MRNVVDHLYGHLLNLARRRNTLKTKNKVLWRTLAPLVARHGPHSFEAKQLMAHATVNRDLKAKLSDLAKRRKDRPSPEELETAYSEYLAFLSSVLGWIDLTPASP